MRKKLVIVLLFVSVFLIIGGVVVMNYTPYVFKTALINYKNTLFSNEQAEKLFPMEVMKISKAKHMLAMGPYLSIGIFIAALWGNKMIDWYVNILCH